MQNEPITASEIEQYRAYVGRTADHEDVVDRRLVRMMASALDVLEPKGELPPLWHYGLFIPSTPTSALDDDGHPRRGDFLPPVRLPRRMFAGSSLVFHQPLKIGEAVARHSKIASVDHRAGKSGDLVFVRVASVLLQHDKPCIEEMQTIVYRPAGGKTPAVVAGAAKPLAPGEVAETWLPLPTELFRYSAATYNTHRIHYDAPYTMGVEGYPGLVVHGPLVATRLAAFAETISGAKLKSFSFRGEAPSFAEQAIRLCGARNGNAVAVRTERIDGVTAMSAQGEV